jgi:hypothetical protein
VLRQRRLQIVLGDEARLDQALTQLFAHPSSAPPCSYYFVGKRRS